MGKRIRDFLRELFGSRLVERLELDLLSLRQDYDSRLQDKDLIIASLREEKQQLVAKVTLYELTLMPRSSRQGAELVAYQKPSKPNFGANFDMPPVMTRWEKVQAEHEATLAAEEEEEKKKAATANKG